MLPNKLMAPALSAMMAVSTVANVPAVYAENTVAATVYSLGDVNGDTNVTSADASLTLEEYARISVSEPSTFTEAQIAAADIDSDGYITSSDASLILSYYSHLSSGGSKSISEYLAWLEQQSASTTIPIVTTTTTSEVTSTTTTSAESTTVPTTTSALPSGDLYTTYNVGTGLNIRASASSTGTILGYIPNGAQFYVTEIDGGWAHTSYNGIDGWVSCNFITRLDNNTTSAVSTTSTTTSTTTTATTTTTSTTTSTTSAPATTTTTAGILYTTYNVNTGLNIRKSASSTAEILGSIPAGAKFYVTETSGGWAHTSYNGITGWVSCDYITKVGSTPTTTTTVTTTTTTTTTKPETTTTITSANTYTTYGVTVYLNIRKSPMISSEAIGSVPPNAKFPVIQTDGLWAYIEYGGVKGWVNCAYICKPGSTTSAHKYPLAANKLNTVGWDLKAAFNAASSIPYYGHTADMPQDANTTMEWYADYGFKNGKGNCYVMAAMFCEMAKSIGYEAHQISGKVPLLAGGYGPHSWVEVKYNGVTYVCDPDFTNETGYNGYLISYGQSGTWRYVKETTMS